MIMKVMKQTNRATGMIKKTRRTMYRATMSSPFISEILSMSHPNVFIASFALYTLRTYIDIRECHDSCGQQGKVFDIGGAGLNSDTVIDEHIRGILQDLLLRLLVIGCALILIVAGTCGFKQSIYLWVGILHRVVA